MSPQQNNSIINKQVEDIQKSGPDTWNQARDASLYSSEFKPLFIQLTEIKTYSTEREKVNMANDFLRLVIRKTADCTAMNKEGRLFSRLKKALIEFVQLYKFQKEGMPVSTPGRQQQ